jgi:hypothetical protein
MSKFIRFLELRETTPPGLDGHRYHMAFQVGEKRGDAFHPTETHAVDVEASRTLQTVWNKSDEQMAAYTGTAASSYVLEMARENRLHELQTLRLNTYTAPKEPPQSPKVEAGAVLPLSDTQPSNKAPGFSFLSEDISEVRDQINALAKDLWGDRILLLSQERPLLDMYKNAVSAEEFRARIQSLGIIIKDLNRGVLGKIAGIDPKDTGDFILLEKALCSVTQASEVESIGTTFKQINYLRQGYPTHGDNAEKFLIAHKHFGLPYPIADFSAAWEGILGQYFAAMKTLLSVLSSAWSNRGPA